MLPRSGTPSTSWGDSMETRQEGGPNRGRVGFLSRVSTQPVAVARALLSLYLKIKKKSHSIHEHFV